MKDSIEKKIGIVHHNREYGITTVKRMDFIDKICRSYSVPTKGIEREYITKNSVNDEKLDNNLSRAKNKIKEYVLCNEWEYFCTLTLAPDKGNRYDLFSFKRKLSKWLNNYNYRFGCSIKYVLIPEFHKDGAIHFHGVFNNIPSSHLIINDFGYLDWENYKKSFGYISLSVIRDKESVAYYITKYITKDLTKHKNELGKHLYLVSKGLKTAEVIFQGEAELKEWKFENEFCKIIEIHNDKEDFNSFIKL